MRYVVVGGGISGVCCARELRRLTDPADEVTLVAASQVVKRVKNIIQHTRLLEELEVENGGTEELLAAGIRVVHGVAVGLHVVAKALLLQGGRQVAYDKLCICTGARPKAIIDSPHVHVVRDLETVQELAARLQTAQRVMVVGNGAIALELVTELGGLEVVWSMKHSHIGDAFFDLDAAEFMLTECRAGIQPAGEDTDASASSRSGSGNGIHPESAQCGTDSDSLAGTSPPTEAASPSFVMRKGRHRSAFGHAMGPQWTRSLRTKGRGRTGKMTLECDTTIESVVDNPHGSNSTATATLSNGRQYGVDVVVSAIGVEPNTGWLPPAVQLADDGGVAVDRSMCSSVADVYAAGDCCTVSWEAEQPHWFQMRLWMQARMLSLYAAHCMLGKADELMTGFNFELFTHVTHFCNKKVVLLGLYNGQKLENEPEQDIVIYVRTTEGKQSTFVRVVLLRGRLQGAVLIGDTDLEETFENLIMDGLDLSAFGPEILDPEVELDHVFD